MTKFHFFGKIAFHVIGLTKKTQRINMSNSWDKNYIYRNAVSPMQRADIFATFREYVSLVTNLESILNKNKVSGLAQLSSQKYYNKEGSCWDIAVAAPQEKERYKNFVNQGQTEIMPKEAYISLNLTSPKHQNDEAGILAVPNSYEFFCGGHSLPHRIERYVLAAPKDETLEDLKITVDGKYTISYKGKDDKIKLMDALRDHDFEMNLMIALDTISIFFENAVANDADITKKAEIEALATAATAPVENILLDALSLMAEESNKIIKKIMGKRVGSSYLAQAEKEELLPSALAVQDYLNIRHLLHHQWDTLDNMGKFNETEVIKNASVRQRFLDSYARLCDKPIKERIKAYSDASAYFLPLVMVLNENIIKREEQESNNAFLKRLENFALSRKDKTVFVITGYDNEEKKQSLANHASKLYPDVQFQFIDKIDQENNMDSLNELVKNYQERRQFIDIFQDMEYRITQYCLYLGKNYTPVIAWDFVRRGNVINMEEAKRWAEYKKLRNDLSHRYMDKSLNAMITEMMPQFIADALKLKKEIEKRTPVVHHIQNNVYRATHANGLVVDIDFANKKVLSITNAKGQIRKPVYKSDPQTQKKHIYTEEYANTTSITMAGTDIVSCRINTGLTISKEKKYIRYPNGVSIYLDSPENIYLTTLNSEKIIMDKNFKVQKYISRGRSINFHRKENSTLGNGHQVSIGTYGEISKDTWVNKENKKIQSSYHKAGNTLYFEYSDGTRIEVTPETMKIFHNNIELTYEDRKKFAESYTDVPPNPPMNKKGRER